MRASPRVLGAAATLAAALGIAAMLGVAAAGSNADRASSLRAPLEQARTSLLDHAADVKAHGGSSVELLARLDADLSEIQPQHAVRSDDEWDELGLNARLDESLVEQLVSGDFVKPAASRGAVALLVRSSADGAPQPLAVYVPNAYDSRRATPLVLMLHDESQTENELLAVPFLRALADQTGVIFAAPFARGDHIFSAAAAGDVYDALTTLEGAFNIDRSRVYLAGVSLGAFGALAIAPKHPERWAGLLAIAGTLTNDDKEVVARAMAGKQVLLVIGADDAVIKPQYVRGSAAYLQASGVTSRYYEQPHGGQSLLSLQPAIEQAWREMFSTMRNVAPDQLLPSPHAAASLRP